MPTLRADPRTHAEILNGGVLETAISACLGGGIEPAHREENSSAPERLILKLSPEFTPRGVCDVTSEVMVLHHPTHVEIFDEDNTEFARDKVRQFMNVVQSLCRNFRVHPRYLDPSFLATRT